MSSEGRRNVLLWYPLVGCEAGLLVVMSFGRVSGAQLRRPTGRPWSLGELRWTGGLESPVPAQRSNSTTARLVKTVKIRRWVAKPKRTRPSVDVLGDKHKLIAIDWVTGRSTHWHVSRLNVQSGRRKSEWALLEPPGERRSL